MMVGVNDKTRETGTEDYFKSLLNRRKRNYRRNYRSCMDKGIHDVRMKSHIQGTELETPLPPKLTFTWHARGRSGWKKQQPRPHLLAFSQSVEQMWHLDSFPESLCTILDIKQAINELTCQWNVCMWGRERERERERLKHGEKKKSVTVDAVC